MPKPLSTASHGLTVPGALQLHTVAPPSSTTTDLPHSGQLHDTVQPTAPPHPPIDYSRIRTPFDPQRFLLSGSHVTPADEAKIAQAIPHDWSDDQMRLALHLLVNQPVELGDRVLSMTIPWRDISRDDCWTRAFLGDVLLRSAGYLSTSLVEMGPATANRIDLGFTSPWTGEHTSRSFACHFSLIARQGLRVYVLDPSFNKDRPLTLQEVLDLNTTDIDLSLDIFSRVVDVRNRNGYRRYTYWRMMSEIEPDHTGYKVCIAEREAKFDNPAYPYPAAEDYLRHEADVLVRWSQSYQS